MCDEVSCTRAKLAMGERVQALEAQVREAREALDDARLPLKWVANHAHRNNAHDMEHAKLALEHVMRARGVLCASGVEGADKKPST